jgi:FixJ family two-component response regulator
METLRHVSLVDDDREFLLALQRLLRSHGYTVRIYASAAEFLECPWRKSAGCLVVDMDMPGMTGLELQQRLNDEGSGLQLLFLTGKGDIPTSVRAMKRGAVNFLTKPVAEEELIPAVEAAIEITEREQVRLVRAASVQSRYNSLTPREQEVMGHLVLGKLNKQTAADLKISLQTVKIHRMRVLAKMGANSVTELVPMFTQIPVGQARSG